MKKNKLNYRFHNPNEAEITAGYILKILIQGNEEKLTSAISESAYNTEVEIVKLEGCSM